MKKFILDSKMLEVLGTDNQDRINSVTKGLTNNWAFVVYPDSAPKNWIDIVSDNFIPFAVSPLHDRDFNADGEPKKPHYHVLLTSDSKKSFKQLFDIAKSVNGTFLINVGNARGYYRYFCHLDNPEKAQYKESDIRCYCGFDSEIYNKAPSYVRYQCIRDMMEYIRTNKITEFCDFVDYARVNHFDDWFRLLCDNSAVIISNYITSIRKYGR